MLDAQVIINIVGGSVLAALGWFARELWNAIKDIQRDVHKIEVDLPNNYVKREELSKGLQDIKDMCDKIFEKLEKLNDRKADK
jgi:translation initiation factor 2B subunit (eIF-2B alpha/beta/delta family)